MFTIHTGCVRFSTALLVVCTSGLEPQMLVVASLNLTSPVYHPFLRRVSLIDCPLDSFGCKLFRHADEGVLLSSSVDVFVGITVPCSQALTIHGAAEAGRARVFICSYSLFCFRKSATTVSRGCQQTLVG